MYSMIKEAMELEFLKFKSRVTKLLGEVPSEDIAFLIKTAYDEGMSEEETAEEIKAGASRWKAWW